MPRATVILRQKMIDDNHPPKGHHRHVEGVEEGYAFVDIDQLIADFVADVERLTGSRPWPRH